jgi:hypothetical protein
LKENVNVALVIMRTKKKIPASHVISNVLVAKVLYKLIAYHVTSTENFKLLDSSKYVIALNHLVMSRILVSAFPVFVMIVIVLSVN